jgi:hypothetical protein
MGIIDRYIEYARAFEETYVDDDWSRVAAYFAPEAVYQPAGSDDPGVRGRDAVCTRLREGVDSFDRRFSRREVRFIRPPRQEGERVVVDWEACYTSPGVPEIVVRGVEVATFEGELIAVLSDTFEPESLARLERWMKEHSAALAGWDSGGGA